MKVHLLLLPCNQTSPLHAPENFEFNKQTNNRTNKQRYKETNKQTKIQRNQIRQACRNSKAFNYARQHCSWKATYNPWGQLCHMTRQISKFSYCTLKKYLSHTRMHAPSCACTHITTCNTSSASKITQGNKYIKKRVRMPLL